MINTDLFYVPFLVSEKIPQIIPRSQKSHWKVTYFSYSTIYLLFIIAENLAFIGSDHIY